jgi:hypothetical protein
VLKLNLQDRLVPARILRQLVVGQDVCPDLILREMGQLNGWDLSQVKETSCLDTAVSGDDGAVSFN